MNSRIQIFFALVVAGLVAVILVVAGYTYSTRPTSSPTGEVYDNAYNVYVDKVFAGNKLLVDVNVGFGITLDDLSVQVSGVVTEPIRTDQGDRARRFTQSAVEGQNVIIKVYEKNDAGRWLVDVIYDNKNLKTELLNSNHGRPI